MKRLGTYFVGTKFCSMIAQKSFKRLKINLVEFGQKNQEKLFLKIIDYSMATPTPGANVIKLFMAVDYEFL
jgi:hypothetical protein